MTSIAPNAPTYQPIMPPGPMYQMPPPETTEKGGPIPQLDYKLPTIPDVQQPYQSTVPSYSPNAPSSQQPQPPQPPQQPSQQQPQQQQPPQQQSMTPITILPNTYNAQENKNSPNAVNYVYQQQQQQPQHMQHLQHPPRSSFATNILAQLNWKFNVFATFVFFILHLIIATLLVRNQVVLTPLWSSLLGSSLFSGMLALLSHV